MAPRELVVWEARRRERAAWREDVQGAICACRRCLCSPLRDRAGLRLQTPSGDARRGRQRPQAQVRRLRRPDTPAITGFPRGPGPGLGLADEKGTVGPGVGLEGAEGSPSPFVPVGVGGTSKSAPWGTAGPCLRHSSGSGGTPLLSERRASREPFSGRPRLGRWDPQASPWERRAPTPSVPRERRDPSPVIPQDPFLVSPWERRALWIRS